MDKKKEEMLEKLRNVKTMENNNLSINGLEDEVQIEDVKFFGQATIIEEIEGEKVEKEINVYAVLEGKNIKYYSDDMCLGYETEGVGIIPSPEYQKKYEENSPIKDVLENLKEKEMSEQEKPQEEKTVQSLEKLEEEKVREYAGIVGKDKEDIKKVSEIYDEEIDIEKDDEEKVDNKKLASVNHLQEMKASTRVNNYETLSGVLGLSGISKFVVVYSEDAAEISKTDGENKNRNNSTYSIIAIKDDGTAINIDNKLELSRSKGTNSSEGRIQTNADGTTEKEYHQASIYNIKGTNRALSLENDNYGEIQVYYGAMTKGALDNEGNQFVGTQLETRSVWPTSRDVRAQEDYRKGEYNADQKADEVKEHLEHGDEKIENINNADGDKKTIADCENDLIPNTDTTWREFANICGYRGEDAIEKAMKEFENYKKDYPDSSNEEIIEEIQEEIENEMPGPNRDRR